MEKMNDIYNELMEISPSLATIEKNKNYSVPPTYFSRLAIDIVDKIGSGVEPVYYFSPVVPFAAPAHYFENLPKNILEKVGDIGRQKEIYDEMEAISPLLNTISKSPVFKVPPQYFSEDGNNLFTLNSQAAKTVALKKLQFAYKYIMAAAVVVLLAIGAFLFIDKKPANFSEGNDSAKMQVNKLSEKDIIEFLKTNSAVDAATTLDKTAIREADVKTSVSKMSDKEIKDFLKENGEGDEI